MLRFSRNLASAVFLGTAIAATPLYASADWELLGTRKVSFNKETDVIEVSRREGRFTALRIEVDHGPLEMHDIRVVFANGESFSPSTRFAFGDGGESRTLDLPGDARSITRIVFRYKSRMRLGSAEVKVYGRQGGADDDHGNGHHDGQYGRPSGDEWTHLGAREVDFRRDHDAMQVEGTRRFTRILLAVEGADIEIYNVSINFANGEHYDPDVRLRFEANSRSRFIDLPGTDRDIRNIEFSYRTLQRGNAGKAVVHVYGKTR